MSDTSLLKTLYHNTAGCFLVRKVQSGWEIVLIYKKWSEGNEGWVPPKGHIENGESLEQTACRETTEETGYQNFKIISFLGTRHIEYPWSDGYFHVKDIHYFLAELIDTKRVELALSREELASQLKVEWMSLEKAKELLKFDDERELLTKVMKLIYI